MPGMITLPLIEGLRALRRRVAGALRPHLGIHYQYPPRPLVVPRSYARTRPPRPAPLFSLVTPSYNQGAFLERTLASVLGQKYPHLEYVVQDGGSTDGTRAVLERYGGQLAGWESLRDRGQAHAINLGFRRTTGAIMAYLNSDDLLLPGALAFVARYFAAHPEADVVYGHRVIIDEKDQEVGRWVLPPHEDEVLRWTDPVPQETVFWRRRVWERVGGAIDESFQFALDWDLLLRFRRAGAVFVRLPRFLGAFRVHAAQKTSARFRDLGAPEVQRLRWRNHGRLVPDTEARWQIRHYLRRHFVYHQLYRLGLLAC
jgi:glycosyltransferase involved in cell wall biosynthesis